MSWELPYNGIGHNPFDEFPSGAPEESISCRWGEDPDLATGAVTDFAWSPIDQSTAAEAQAHLEATGYQRSEAPEGVYLTSRGEPGWADAEGYGYSFLFTDEDVRWAMTKAELRFVKAPTESK